MSKFWCVCEKCVLIILQPIMLKVSKGKRKALFSWLLPSDKGENMQDLWLVKILNQLSNK